MIAAIVLGALTAWYLGVRLGVIVAAITFGALLLAAFVPGMTMTVYALVIAWAAALYFLGPKISKATNKPGASSMFSPLNQATAWAKKLWDRAAK
ncbi:MAG: hypothetical protein JO257_37770 [Deltaproteobacteria bacterium]|nr:hypothetical protein [Deltaproteobacteria bacterium]